MKLRPNPLPRLCTECGAPATLLECGREWSRPVCERCVAELVACYLGHMGSPPGQEPVAAPTPPEAR